MIRAPLARKTPVQLTSAPGNKAAAVLTLLGDAAKGWLAVWLAQVFGVNYGIGDAGVALVAMAVFAGHIWPLYTRFVVARAWALRWAYSLGISPWVWVGGTGHLVAGRISVPLFIAVRLAAAALAPLYYGLFFVWTRKMFAVALMSGLLIWRHSSNIGNLLKGKESKIGSKKK